MLIVSEDTVHKYLPNAINASLYSRLKGAHKADFFRAHVLGTRSCTLHTRMWLVGAYGGMYIDADTMGWGKPVMPLYKLIERDWDMVNADWAPIKVPLMIGVMGPWRAHTSVARVWAKAQDETLQNFSQALFAGLSSTYLLDGRVVCRWQISNDMGRTEQRHGSVQSVVCESVVYKR